MKLWALITSTKQNDKEMPSAGQRNFKLFDEKQSVPDSPQLTLTFLVFLTGQKKLLLHVAIH